MSQTYRQRKEVIERRLIVDTLAAHSTVAAAALALGMRGDSLYRRIRLLGIEREDRRLKRVTEPTAN